MPKDIQTPLVGSTLQRLFRLQGRIRLVLGEEVIPVVKVADLSTAAPDPVRRLAMFQAQQAAVVGELATFVMVVPPTVLCHVNEIFCLPTTLQQVRANVSDATAVSTAGYTVSTASFYDSRLAGQLPALNPLRGTQAAGITLPSWSDVFEPQTAGMLPPRRTVSWLVGGDPSGSRALVVQATVANEAVRLGLAWEEYQVN